MKPTAGIHGYFEEYQLPAARLQRQRADNERRKVKDERLKGESEI